MTVEQEEAVERYMDRLVDSGIADARTVQDMCQFRSDFFAKIPAEAIPKTLQAWNLAERIRSSPDEPVVVTANGVKWLPETSHLERWLREESRAGFPRDTRALTGLQKAGH